MRRNPVPYGMRCIRGTPSTRFEEFKADRKVEPELAKLEKDLAQLKLNLDKETGKNRPFVLGSLDELIGRRDAIAMQVDAIHAGSLSLAIRSAAAVDLADELFTRAMDMAQKSEERLDAEDRALESAIQAAEDAMDAEGHHRWTRPGAADQDAEDAEDEQIAIKDAEDDQIAIQERPTKTRRTRSTRRTSRSRPRTRKGITGVKKRK